MHYGAPWKLNEIIEGLKDNKIKQITPNEKLNIILEHLNLAVAEKTLLW